jgi:FkbM family methyltransferase
MNESLVLGLPNGKACYFTSTAMRTVAKYLRWETFERGQYWRRGFELRADDTVIDIGANIGMFALWTEPQIPRGRLICIEPNPRALECLRMNIRQNDLRNATIVPAAVGDGNSVIELVCHPGWEAMAHVTAVDAPWFLSKSRMGRLARWLMQRSLRHPHQTAAAKPIMVQLMPLARIMDEHGVATVNFLKIDCEGSEYEVLRSLGAAHWARIERVVIEYHDLGRDRNHHELIEILRNNGFEAEATHTILEGLFALVGVRLGMIWAKKCPPAPAASARVTAIGATSRSSAVAG